MSDDEQTIAELTDDDVVSDEQGATSEAVDLDYPPDRPMGLPFADADVTDESISDRHEREEPEVWEQATPRPSEHGGAADEQLEQIIEP